MQPLCFYNGETLCMHRRKRFNSWHAIISNWSQIVSDNNCWSDGRGVAWWPARSKVYVMCVQCTWCVFRTSQYWDTERHRKPGRRGAWGLDLIPNGAFSATTQRHGFFADPQVNYEMASRKLRWHLVMSHDLVLPEAPQILSALDFELIFGYCVFRNLLLCLHFYCSTFCYGPQSFRSFLLYHNFSI